LLLSANGEEDGSLSRIVSALEGQVVPGSSRAWTVRVQGVHGNDRDWWIQLAPDEDDSAGVVLRCSRHATPAQASAVLRQWSPRRARSIRILRVMTVD
jgi:phage-related baseplate assembly protein